MAIAAGRTLSDYKRDTYKMRSHPKKPGRTVKGVDKRLTDIVQKAAHNFSEKTNYDVTVRSGSRPGDDGQHGEGDAIDVTLVDRRTGEIVPDYQTPETFHIYQGLANEVRAVQMKDYPELEDGLRWGGYFSGRIKKLGIKGTYGAMDLMHFDLGGLDGLGMVAGSWANGLDPKWAKKWGVDMTPEGFAELTPPQSVMDTSLQGTYGTVQAGVEDPRAISALQTRLNKLGASLDVTGEWDAATESAVKAYQGISGLKQDGIVGTNTWGAIEQAINPTGRGPMGSIVPYGPPGTAPALATPGIPSPGVQPAMDAFTKNANTSPPGDILERNLQEALGAAAVKRGRLPAPPAPAGTPNAQRLADQHALARELGTAQTPFKDVGSTAPPAAPALSTGPQMSSPRAVEGINDNIERAAYNRQVSEVLNNAIQNQNLPNRRGVTSDEFTAPLATDAQKAAATEQLKKGLELASAPSLASPQDNAAPAHVSSGGGLATAQDNRAAPHVGRPTVEQRLEAAKKKADALRMASTPAAGPRDNFAPAHIAGNLATVGAPALHTRSASDLVRAGGANVVEPNARPQPATLLQDLTETPPAQVTPRMSPVAPAKPPAPPPVPTMRPKDPLDPLTNAITKPPAGAPPLTPTPRPNPTPPAAPPVAAAPPPAPPKPKPNPIATALKPKPVTVAPVDVKPATTPPPPPKPPAPKPVTTTPATTATTAAKKTTAPVKAPAPPKPAGLKPATTQSGDKKNDDTAQKAAAKKKPTAAGTGTTATGGTRGKSSSTVDPHGSIRGSLS